MENKAIRKVPLIAILAVSLLMVGALGAYIMHYRLEQGASVTVGSNGFKLSLFWDEACTQPVSTLTFPAMAEGDPNQVSTTPEVYVKAPNKPVGETVFIKWTCAQPPVNMAISAQRALKNTVSGEWNAWQSWTQADASQLSLTDATYRNIVKIRFTLTPTNGIATGTHGFTVYLDGLEDDTL